MTLLKKYSYFFVLNVCLAALFIFPFHMSAQSSVSNLVWYDADRDGFQDSNEMGIPNVEVEIYKIDKGYNFVSSQLTDANGEYKIENLDQNSTYQLRIKLDQPAFDVFQNLQAAKLDFYPNDFFDSDGNPYVIPNHVLVNFATRSFDLDFTQYDFGFYDDFLEEYTLGRCEFTLGAGAARFDLVDILQSIGEIPGYDYTFYNSFVDLKFNINPIVDPTFAAGSTKIYLKATSSMDPMYYSWTVINLNMYAEDTEINFMKTVCPGSRVNFSEIVNAEVDEIHFYEDSGRTTEIGTTETIAELPETIYYDLSHKMDTCTGYGEIVFTDYLLPSIDAGEHPRICYKDSVKLFNTGFSYNPERLPISDVSWASKGDGRFITAPDIAQASYYVPGEEEIREGKLVLYLSMTEMNCGRTVTDSVEVSIINELIFFECKQNTILCSDEAASDVEKLKKINPPFLLYDCDPTDPEFLSLESKYAICEDTLQVHYREWIFKTKEASKKCQDTVYVLPLKESIECPASYKELDCSSRYATDDFGNPSPALSGIPSIGGVPTFPHNQTCNFLSTYKDNVLEGTCGNKSKIIFREWEVKNICTSEYKTCKQEIVVQDITQPRMFLGSFDYNRIDRDTIYLSANNNLTCEAEFDPALYVKDDCSGVKSLKLEFPLLSRSLSMELVDKNIWKLPTPLQIPKYTQNYKGYIPIRFEVIDSCHNKEEIYKYIKILDVKPPVAIANRQITAKMAYPITFIDKESVGEGKGDNCQLLDDFARNPNWINDLDYCPSFLDTLKDIQVLFKMPLFNDLREKQRNKYQEFYLKAYDWLDEYNPCHKLLKKSYEYEVKQNWIATCIPADEHGNARFRSEELDSLYQLSGYNPYDLSVIGGGWSDEILASYVDECSTLKGEYIVFDQYCHYDKSWSLINFEEIEPTHEVKCELDDLYVSCHTYDKYDDLFKSAMLGDKVALSKVDSLFGTYRLISFWDSSEYSCDFNVLDFHCIQKDSIEKIKYEDHDGNIKWREEKVTYYRDSLINHLYKNGLVKVSSPKTKLHQTFLFVNNDCDDKWIERNFYLISACKKDTLEVFKQKIYVDLNYCVASKGMIVFPSDGEVCIDSTQFLAPNISIPDSLSTLRFFSGRSSGCMKWSYAIDNKVFRIQNGYKILRYYDIWESCQNIRFSHTQKLIVTDNCISDDKVTAIDKVENQVKIQVAPNPIKEGRHIKVSVGDDMNIQNLEKIVVLNVDNQKVMSIGKTYGNISETTNSIEFKLNNNISNGFYYLIVTFKNGKIGSVPLILL